MAWTIVVPIIFKVYKEYLWTKYTLCLYMAWKKNRSGVQNLEIAYIYCCSARLPRAKYTKGQNLPLIT